MDFTKIKKNETVLLAMEFSDSVSNKTKDIHNSIKKVFEELGVSEDYLQIVEMSNCNISGLYHYEGQDISKSYNDLEIFVLDCLSVNSTIRKLFKDRNPNCKVMVFINPIKELVSSSKVLQYLNRVHVGANKTTFDTKVNLFKAAFRYAVNGINFKAGIFFDNSKATNSTTYHTIADLEYDKKVTSTYIKMDRKYTQELFEDDFKKFLMSI